MPTDPQGGGTWLATTDAGLTLALLNYNPANPSLGTPGEGRVRAHLPKTNAAPAAVIPQVNKHARNACNTGGAPARYWITAIRLRAL